MKWKRKKNDREYKNIDKSISSFDEKRT